jgi:hypothetical protein
MTIDLHMPHRKILSHATMCVIDRRVAVRMEPAKDVTYGRRTFTIRFVSGVKPWVNME